MCNELPSFKVQQEKTNNIDESSPILEKFPTQPFTGKSSSSVHFLKNDARMADKQRQGVNKKMQVEEMKHRLKEGVKSLNENFLGIFRAAKIDSGNPQQQGGNHAMGQAGPRAATKEEMAARAALMISRISQSFDVSGVKVCDDLKTLTNEMREFFIVNDFAVVDSALRNAEAASVAKCEEMQEVYINLQVEVADLITKLDEEHNANYNYNC
ncbi:hypothetical protein WR25_16864 [Diploscapter pachys]|uniref:Uncharacterized protein n=1 Tax=Diploscapter pachys TaxID=2018661 RepID=A0A2A2LDQ7_9BILA|nr:hypothetical protein WR25_16864 [Diploscapter pachys]